MKKIITIALLSILLGACTVPFTKTKKSALDIKSEPKAAVFLNGDHVGSTPFYKDDLKPGDYTVKLSLESDPGRTWQTQTSLKPQLLTNITKSFGETEEVSSHFTLSLEPLSKTEETKITMITLPDSAVVKVDGQPVGFAPVEIDTISPGDHQIIIGSPGYKQLTIPVKAIQSHSLVITAQLAKDKDLTLKSDQANDSSPSASPKTDTNNSTAEKPTSKTATSSAVTKPYVTIIETGTGWLRVRSEPTGFSDNEVAKVNVGEKYSLIETNQTGWHKIEYFTGKQGWISTKYATVTE
ncbi:PEGA domain-containing protein [Patescibacteria group bacterium]